VDQSKTVEGMIMKCTPYGSPIPLVFAGKFNPEILTGSSTPDWGRQTRDSWEKQAIFYSFKRQYLENGRRYVQNTYY